MAAKLEFKIASEDWEFEQIYELNYRTFVEEIPQHNENERRSLVDKFHSENSYLICTRDGKLLGMMAVRDKRPFSLDLKLEDLDSYLPQFNCPCEFRLLSIEKEVRNLRIIQGLMVVLSGFADEKGYDIALISANVKRLSFYKQIGFKPFGPEVGTNEACYQPMYLTLKSSNEFRRRSKILKRLPENFSVVGKGPLNLLPGPVSISDNVKKAMNEPPVSHRSEGFIRDFHAVRQRLCELTGARYAEVLMGSGSLANDAVAAQLSLTKTKGLILSNGEFGERLFDHGERAGLDFDHLSFKWGEALDPGRIEGLLERKPEIGWLLAVHSETSTGVLNDLNTLQEICGRRELKLCLDCVSSLGTVPIDLSGVYLATGVSGKGLASYSGLSFVFYNHEIFLSSESIPKYLDIGFYAGSNGVPFTLSSNLVYALGAALGRFDSDTAFAEVKELSGWMRAEIRNAGFEIIAKDEYASPALVTISLPDWICSTALGKSLEESGYLLHWRSVYLTEKNWIQIALMGDAGCRKTDLAALVKLLHKAAAPVRRAL